MQIESVVILGGSGFIGRHLTTQLAAAGKRVRVLSRRPARQRALLVLPRVEVIQANVHDSQALEHAIAGHDAVINLVGILNERARAGHRFSEAHPGLVKTIIEACRKQSVRRLLHMSALHADAARGSSRYQRSKGEAENLLHTFAGRNLAVTSFRPSVVFGPGDGLFSRFAQLLRLSPVLPLACPRARFAPVYVGDVVRIMISALEDKRTFDQHIDLCGPEVFELREIVEYTAACLGLKRWVVPLSPSLSRIQAMLLEWVPGKPFTRDNYDSLQVDSVCGDTPPQPTAIASIVPGYLTPATRLSERLQRFRRYANRE